MNYKTKKMCKKINRYCRKYFVGHFGKTDLDYIDNKLFP